MKHPSKSTKNSLCKVSENAGFHWLIFFRVKTESTILCLYGEMRVSKDPFSDIFNAMIGKLRLQERPIMWTKYLGWILLFTRSNNVIPLLFFYTPWGYRKRPEAWNRLIRICNLSSSSNRRSYSECFLETIWIKSFLQEPVDITPWFWLKINQFYF